MASGNGKPFACERPGWDTQNQTADIKRYSTILNPAVGYNLNRATPSSPALLPKGEGS
jgi:hypothetical protein